MKKLLFLKIPPIFTKKGPRPSARMNRPILCGQYKKEACKG